MFLFSYWNYYGPIQDQSLVFLGDDSTSNVRRLCFKGQNPIRSDLVEKLGVGHLNITCGAVCVYSSRVPDAKKALADAKSNLPVASVAFGFPAGKLIKPP